jgi:hypothetical protein
MSAAASGSAEARRTPLGRHAARAQRRSLNRCAPTCPRRSAAVERRPVDEESGGGSRTATAAPWSRGASPTEQSLVVAFMVVPLLALAAAVPLAAGCYFLTGLGATVGFHRRCTHVSLEAKHPLRIALAVAPQIGALAGAYLGSWRRRPRSNRDEGIVLQAGHRPPATRLFRHRGFDAPSLTFGTRSPAIATGGRPGRLPRRTGRDRLARPGGDVALRSRASCFAIGIPGPVLLTQARSRRPTPGRTMGRGHRATDALCFT